MGASRVLTAVVAHSLAQRDTSISVPQLRVLVMLSAAERLNVTAVAESLGVVASNASRTCDRLVAAGLVDRSEDEVDRRSVLFALSPAGRSLVAALMNSRRAVLADVLREMSPADCRRLADGLQAFRSAAAHMDADGTLARAESHFLRWV